VLVNGKSSTSITAFDRGLYYGDGLFETIAVSGGRPRLWQRHMLRLSDGCERLGIPFPGDELLHEEAVREIDNRELGVLKIIITRGEGGRGYRPPREPHPSRILHWGPWPDYPVTAHERGVTARICSTRLDHCPEIAGIKHLNRLQQVMASREWDDPEIAEGLMLDSRDHLIEGIKSNLFLIKGDSLLTPDLQRCGVAGVMRGLVMDVAAEMGIEVKVTDLGLPDLWDSEGLFLTNSLIGIWPLREVNGRAFAVDAIDAGLKERVLQLALAPE
jgi:4-amino-4-deoxychorismate lyase